ncbi:MAG TPA: glycosyltransferase family 4 protein [bacterium]|nr:glycosyltransferase family 4 protein [bacterium]
MADRVIFIEPSGRGGIGQYTYSLAREMVNLGLEVVVATSENWEFRDQVSGIIPCLCFRAYRTNPGKVRAALEEFITEQTLAIHWQSTTHPCLLWLLQIFIRNGVSEKPWVFTVHNVLPHEARKLDRFFYSRIYDRMQGLIFHGRTSRARFESTFSLKNRRWAVIPHGEYVFHFENEPAPGPNLNAKTVLFFGNIRPYKGLIYLLRAFQLVREQIPGARLQIAGQPLADFTSYQKEIDLLGMSRHIDLQLRYIPNDEVRQIFSQATVVALPYTDIYQSAVVHLAYGAGLPVVASSVGDLADTVVDGETGYLVPPKDVPALRDALIKILSNPERCRQMGEKARELADKEYNWSNIARRTIEFYRTLRNKSA